MRELLEDKYLTAIVNGDFSVVQYYSVYDEPLRWNHRLLLQLGYCLDDQLDNAMPLVLALKICLAGFVGGNPALPKHVQTFFSLLNAYKRAEHPSYFECLISFYQYAKKHFSPPDDLLFESSPVTQAAMPYRDWLKNIEYRLLHDRVSLKFIEKVEAHYSALAIQKSKITAWLQQNLPTLQSENNPQFHETMRPLMKEDQQGHRTWVSVFMFDVLFNEAEAMMPLDAAPELPKIMGVNEVMMQEVLSLIKEKANEIPGECVLALGQGVSEALLAEIARFEIAFDAVMKMPIAATVRSVIDKKDIYYIYYLAIILKLPFDLIKTLLTKQQRESGWAFAAVLNDLFRKPTDYDLHFSAIDKSTGYLVRRVYFCVCSPRQINDALVQFESSPYGSTTNTLWYIYMNKTSLFNFNHPLMMMGLIQFLFLSKNPVNAQHVASSMYGYLGYYEACIRWAIEGVAVEPYQYRNDLDQLARLEIDPKVCSTSFRAFIAYGDGWKKTYGYQNNIQTLKEIAIHLLENAEVRIALGQQLILGGACPFLNILMFDELKHEVSDETPAYKTACERLYRTRATAETIAILKQRLNQSPTPRDVLMLFSFGLGHAVFQKRRDYMVCLMQPASEAILLELHAAMKFLNEDERKSLRTRLASDVLAAINDPKHPLLWMQQLHGCLMQGRRDLPLIEILQTSGSGKRHQQTETYKNWEKDFCKKLGLARPPKPGKVFGGEHTVFSPREKVQKLTQDSSLGGVLPDNTATFNGY